MNWYFYYIDKFVKKVWEIGLVLKISQLIILFVLYFSWSSVPVIFVHIKYNFDNHFLKINTILIASFWINVRPWVSNLIFVVLALGFWWNWVILWRNFWMKMVWNEAVKWWGMSRDRWWLCPCLDCRKMNESDGNLRWRGFERRKKLIFKKHT